MFWGFALVIAGVLMILARADIIPGDFWDYVVPIVLVAFGLKMIFGRKVSRS